MPTTKPSASFPYLSRQTQQSLLVLVVALVVLAAPLFVSTGTVLLLGRVVVLGLFAMSLNFLVGNTGLVSFGHALFFGLGAYVVVIAAVKYDQNALVFLALAPIVGAVVAFLSGLVVLRNRDLYFGLLTLGVAQLAWSIANGWYKFTGGQDGLSGRVRPGFLDSITRQYWFVVILALLFALVLWRLKTSSFGAALRGIRDNPERASLIGINVHQYRLVAYVFAGSVGAAAGGLQGIWEQGTSIRNLHWSLSALALIFCLVGGVGYFFGPVVGALLYVFLQAKITQIGSFWDLVLGFTVLAVAILAPRGLLGGLSSLFGRGRGSRGPVIQDHVDSDSVMTIGDISDSSTRVSSNGAVGEPKGPESFETKIRIEGLNKWFGGQQATKDLDLEVRSGEIHALIGPNGAGKSTILNQISGLVRPDSGRIFVDQIEVSNMQPHERARVGIARSMQQSSLFWDLTARQNLELTIAARYNETKSPVSSLSARTRDEAQGVIDALGLNAIAETPAINLSHGDQRALELSLALAMGASCVLLDEPTAGLAPGETVRAAAWVKDVAKRHGLTVLFVEHDMSVVFGIADRVSVLNFGELIMTGSPDDVRANVAVQEAYLGASAGLDDSRA